jgi:tRNA(adenine34) deaminase
MIEALEEAKKSLDFDNVPVGAVLVYGDKVISRFFNSSSNAINHAEILCINEGYKLLQKKYLEECELFVTLEPCNMCYSAILLSRIKKVFFGAFSYDVLNRDSYFYLEKVRFYGGFLEKESSLLIKKFFKNRRNS